MIYKRFLSTLGMLLSVTGCSVSGMEFEAAMRLCEPHGGVDSMVPNITAPTSVYCMDTTVFSPADVKNEQLKGHQQ